MIPKSPTIGYQSTPGSHSSPSQPKSGIAATIQFHPGTTGCTPIGFAFPAAIAGAPKHTAIHPAPVRVGVTNSLTKFVGEVTPRDPPAPGHQQAGQGIKVAEFAGYTDGRQHGLVPQLVCLPVRAENTGIPSFTLSPSPIGIPNNVGSFPGASGAQLRGLAKQLPPPNQQLSHSISWSISHEISSIAPLIASSAPMKSVALSVLSILSSVSGIPSPSES